MSRSSANDQQELPHGDADLSIPADYVATLFDLSGRVAVVTGGGSGLGRAIAMGYAQAGVRVVVADLNDEGAAETARLIRDQHGHAEAAPLDVTRRDQVEALVEQVVARHSRLDILVNSAGSAFRSPAEDFPEEKPDFILDLNLKGTYLCCQAAQRSSITADFIKARMLRPRLGLPRELIGAAIFLASDAAELVTGHTIMCDDGYLVA